MNLIKSILSVSTLWRFTLLVMLLFAGKLAASPELGEHALAFYPCGGSGGLSTPAITTQVAGSTMLAWVGRGASNQFTQATIPIDNKGNRYSLLGIFHDYSPRWSSSGEALYVSASATGGSNYIVTAPMTGPDEITLAVIEVKNGGVIQDVKWNKVTAPPQTSLNVTTTDAATLVAIWCGDSGDASVTATPDNGFSIIDSQLLAGCDVEVVVATKDVTAAGAYNVTWTATPTQGTHMWLVAVQSPPPALQAQATAGNVIVSWPISDGYSLETTTNLAATNSWTSITNTPTTVDALNIMTNGISPGSEFYRLKKP